MNWGHRTSASERLFLAACMHVASSGDVFGFIARGGELAHLPGYDECRNEIVVAGEAIILIKVQEAIDLYKPLSPWNPGPKGKAERAHRRLMKGAGA